MTMVHFQLGIGGPHGATALCGKFEAKNEPKRCLTDCDPCEGDRDKVDCPRCIELAKQIHENVAYFFRADGPHAA